MIEPVTDVRQLAREMTKFWTQMTKVVISWGMMIKKEGLKGSRTILKNVFKSKPTKIKLAIAAGAIATWRIGSARMSSQVSETTEQAKLKLLSTDPQALKTHIEETRKDPKTTDEDKALIIESSLRSRLGIEDEGISVSKKWNQIKLHIDPMMVVHSDLQGQLAEVKQVLQTLEWPSTELTLEIPHAAMAGLTPEAKKSLMTDKGFSESLIAQVS